MPHRLAPSAVAAFAGVIMSGALAADELTPTSYNSPEHSGDLHRVTLTETQLAHDRWPDHITPESAADRCREQATSPMVPMDNFRQRALGRAFAEIEHMPLTQALYAATAHTGVLDCIQIGMTLSAEYYPRDDLTFIPDHQFSTVEPVINAGNLTHERAHILQYDIIRNYLIDRLLLQPGATIGEAFDKLYECMPRNEAVAFMLLHEAAAETTTIASLLGRQDNMEALQRFSTNLFSQMRHMTLFALERMSVEGIDYHTLSPDERSAFLQRIAGQWFANDETVAHYARVGEYLSDENRFEDTSCRVHLRDLPLEALFTLPDGSGVEVLPVDLAEEFSPDRGPEVFMAANEFNQ